MAETIAAISTPSGKGGVAIVRMSGDDALIIADKVFKGKKKIEEAESHTVLYGRVFSEEGVIDECLCTVMKAPKSYTTENVVEINVHGGSYSANKTLEAVIKKGARPAKAGEFTLRAFVNGRIDLSEAEAVTDIIEAKTSLAQSSAVNQLEGKLKDGINKIRGKIIEILSFITVASDFPDEDSDSLSGTDIKEEIRKVKEETEALLKNADKGIILREGAVCAICGKPNVGKSSLLNLMAGEEKAIVTDLEGTTRDIIEEYINISGVPVRLADTAGIRENAEEIEKIGVIKAREYIKKADICLFVIDNSRLFDKEDEKIYSELKDKNVIAVINKAELEERCSIPEYIKNPIYISAKTGEGKDELEERIYEEIMGNDFSSDSVMITNNRHKEACIAAYGELEKALASMESGVEEDISAIYLEGAAAHLGEITGMTVSEEVIDEVFSRFCIGK